MSEREFGGVGQALASAREARGLSQSDVAEKLKLTARQIDALEKEEYGKLPAMVFVRGFIRNYARLLSLDADSLADSVGGANTVSETITAPSEGVTLSRTPLVRWLAYIVGGLGAFLLLVALLYGWLRQVGEEPGAGGAESQTIVLPELPPPAREALPAVTPPQETVLAPAIPAADGTTVTQVVPVPTLPSASASASASARPGPAAASAPPASLPPAAAGTVNSATVRPVESVSVRQGDNQTGVNLLRFTASEESWVQVVDGQGRRYSKLISAGGTDTVSGAPPFRIVVGNAASVRVHYNNQMIDLRPHTGQKVARLTLE